MIPIHKEYMIPVHKEVNEKWKKKHCDTRHISRFIPVHPSPVEHQRLRVSQQ